MRIPEAPKTVSNKLSTNGFSAHILNIAVTLTIAYFAFSGTQSTNDANMLESAFTRMQAQDATISRLTKELQATNTKVLELEAMVRINMSAGNAAIQATVNTLPIPFWIKQKQADDTFVMFMINDAYTSQFNVTRNDYIGFTDDHLHPAELAEKYRINDLLVSDSKKTLRTSENVSVNGELVPIQVFKFPVNIPSCQNCVGGLAITYEF